MLNYPLRYMHLCALALPSCIFSSKHARSSSHRDWSRSKYKLLSLFKLMAEGIREKRLGEPGENGHSKEKVDRTFPETVMHITHSTYYY